MSTPIIIGTSDDRDVGLDLDVLLRTRLLIQASSGGGKSWLIRRLAEQLLGRVQVLILDPEGEFSSLRERYGFVLVGKGGETPADRRSAALVARKLLELRASAVCDLYELPPRERHAWVKLFLDALVDSPKELWHPVVVIVDEAHVFAPEKGAGESEASESMIGLASRGRKRGFCPVFATQRLGKLRKDAAAELLNVLVGQTFVDVDRDRAADAIGVPRAQRHEFFAQLRLLRPGKFWALGRAISKERVLVSVGPVLTSHPEAGTTGHATEPPPAPEQVRRLLPKLADLPAEAEQEAKTAAELRAQVAELKRQLAAKPTPPVPPAPKIERVEVSVLRDAQAKRLNSAANRIAGACLSAVEAAREVLAAVEKVVAPVPVARPSIPARPPVAARLTRPAQTPRTTAETDGNLTGPEQRILDAAAWLASLGIDEPQQAAVAFLAGYKIGGGAYNNPRGRLRVAGMIEYLPGDRMRLTEDGHEHAHAPDQPLTVEELHRRVLERLPGPEQRILRVLIGAYPDGLANDELARAAGYEPGGGAYNNPRGRLRTLGLVDYRSGEVVARPLLFLEASR